MSSENRARQISTGQTDSSRRAARIFLLKQSEIREYSDLEVSRLGMSVFFRILNVLPVVAAIGAYLQIQNSIVQAQVLGTTTLAIAAYYTTKFLIPMSVEASMSSIAC